MLPGMEMMACQHLEVPAEVMQHIVEVESGSNPYAIGVVGGQLVRQPKNLGEALATVKMLDAKGYNFSVGMTQVNRANLGKYGLDSYEQAFDTCPNLAAGARILAECYASSGGDWGKSFSCYYSGNFVTGYRDGYVQKVYASIGRSANTSAADNAVAAIPLQLGDLQATSHTAARATIAVPSTSDSAAYRIAIRSMVLDAATDTATAPLAKALTTTAATSAEAPRTPAPSTPSDMASASATTAPAGSTALSSASPTMTDVFEPQVRGPNDPPSTAAPANNTPPQVAATAAARAPDQADLRQGGGDDAFVF